MQDSSELRRFLVRAVLDDAFRRLALEAPDEAFDGFGLTDDEKRTLRSRDDGVLALIGRVVRAEMEASVPAGAATAANAPEATPAAPRGLPRAVPEGQPIAARPLPEIELKVRILPHAVPLPDGTLSVGYAAAIVPPPAPEIGPSPPAASWTHGIDAPAVERAAQAVRDADAADRIDCLLDLAAALRESTS